MNHFFSDIVCEIAGIEEFSKLLQEADPDPIYLCEKVKFCPHSTTAAANITALTISPTTGAQVRTENDEAMSRFQVTTEGGMETVLP